MTLTVEQHPKIINNYNISKIFYQNKPISIINTEEQQLWVENDLIRALGITDKYLEQFLHLNPLVANWIQQMLIPEISYHQQRVWEIEAVYWLAATRNKFFIWEDVLHFIYEQRYPL